jgi:hypothetical protein
MPVILVHRQPPVIGAEVDLRVDLHVNPGVDAGFDVMPRRG